MSMSLKMVMLVVALAAVDAGAAEAGRESIWLRAETNLVCRHLYIGVGDEVRAGDAVAALDPVGAEERIAAARLRHVDCEREFQAQRTNQLATLQRQEQGKATEEEVAAARRDFQRVSRARAESMADLNRTHREFRTRVIYAPVAGRVASIPVAIGQGVEPGGVVLELKPATGER